MDLKTTPSNVSVRLENMGVIMRIKYISEVRSQCVIDIRPFSSVDGLDAVKGIGPTYLQSIKDEGIACVG
jgi:DNA uptake protein ComE-like DNA-binding protein